MSGSVALENLRRTLAELERAVERRLESTRMEQDGPFRRLLRRWGLLS
jgi:hypothetical protein